MRIPGENVMLQYSATMAGLILSLLPVFACAQVGDVTAVHDPSIIESEDRFYVFSTGRGIYERSSPDLYHWARIGRVLSSNPDWTRAYGPKPNASLWAPDISMVDGEYRLYFAISSFGTTASAVGLLVNQTLDPTSPRYKWIDRGEVIATAAHGNWNAIDPCAFLDADGKTWMVLGSCWSGLKLVRLDRQTGLLANPGAPPLSIAAYPPRNIIEEGYIRRRGDYCYLWESVDYCCRGVNSTYRILVGRSKTVQGPYLDRDAKPMLDGGGTLVLASYGAVRGPGSCAIVDLGDRQFLVHHEYDGNNHGIPTLQIRPLFWSTDGWPVASEPITHPPSGGDVTHHQTSAVSVVGRWSVRKDFGESQDLLLRADGTLSPSTGTWSVDGEQLHLTRTKAARVFSETYFLAEDGSFFTGRDAEGAVILAKRDKIVP